MPPARLPRVREEGGQEPQQRPLLPGEEREAPSSRPLSTFKDRRQLFHTGLLLFPCSAW